MVRLADDLLLAPIIIADANVQIQKMQGNKH